MGVYSQNSSRVDVVENNCTLEKRTVTLQYSDSYNNSSVIDEFNEILVFQSRPRTVVKTSRSGKSGRTGKTGKPGSALQITREDDYHIKTLVGKFDLTPKSGCDSSVI